MMMRLLQYNVLQPKFPGFKDIKDKVVKHTL